MITLTTSQRLRRLRLQVKALGVTDAKRIVKRCDLCGGAVIADSSQKQVPGIGTVLLDSCERCNKIQ